MRTIHLSLTTLTSLFGTVACVAACSSAPTVSPTSSSTPTSGSSPGASTASGATSSADAHSISLTGDGHALHLNGAPADPAYVATYPVSGLTAMTITASTFGDLTASCASSSGAVTCKSLPFFAGVSGSGGSNVAVYDAFGHVIMSIPLPPFDAGALPVVPSPPSPPSPPSVPSPPSGPSLPTDAGTSNGTSGATASCAPSVTASLSGCTLTVGTTTCDCSDASCAASAIEACLGAAGVPVGTLDDAGGLGGLLPDDGGLPGLGSLLPDDGGLFGAGCSAATIASTKTQFCSDVDAWLAAHGMATTTLDCNAIGTLSFPTSLPTASTSGFTCDQITHDAFVKVRAALATCNPLDYVDWDSSAELQLFEDSACTVW
jgi:hypothetical protein